MGAVSFYLLSTFINHSNSDINESKESTLGNISSISTTQNPISQLAIERPDELIALETAINTKKQTTLTTQLNLSTNKLLSEKIVELEATNLKLEQKYQRTKRKLMEVTREKEALDESNISDSQMLSLVDDEFAQFRRQSKGKQRDNLYEFHQQEVDLNWGYQMNIHIADFIQTHYNSSLVSLEGLTCKLDTCELLVSESESGGWPPIMRGMREQPWWAFTSTQSSSRFGDNDKNLYYLYLSN